MSRRNGGVGSVRADPVRIDPAALDALQAHAMVMSRQAVIVSVNAAWFAHFERIGFPREMVAPGASYREMVRATLEVPSGGFDELLGALDAIAEGADGPFSIDVARADLADLESFRISLQRIPGSDQFLMTSWVMPSVGWSLVGGRPILAGGADLHERAQFDDEVAAALGVLPPAGSVAVGVLKILGIDHLALQLGRATIAEFTERSAYRVSKLKGVAAAHRAEPGEVIFVAEGVVDGAVRLEETIRAAFDVEMIFGPVAISLPVALGVTLNLQPLEEVGAVVQRARAVLGREVLIRAEERPRIRRLDLVDPGRGERAD